MKTGIDPIDTVFSPCEFLPDMAKSIRCKRDRKMKAIKRVKNFEIQKAKLLEITAELQPTNDMDAIPTIEIPTVDMSEGASTSAKKKRNQKKVGVMRRYIEAFY